MSEGKFNTSSMEELTIRDKDEFKFVLLTHKDTDILALSAALDTLPADFPPVDKANLTDIASDTDMEEIIQRTSHSVKQLVIIVRLLGRGVPGFQRLIDFARNNSSQSLIVVSGVPGSFEPDLTAMSTVPSTIIDTVMRYFEADGSAYNMSHLLRFLAHHLLHLNFEYNPPRVQPDHGLYHPRYTSTASEEELTQYFYNFRSQDPTKPTVAIVFYRCHFLSGNTAFVDALIDELDALGVNAIGVFTQSLREETQCDNVNGKPVSRFPIAFKYLLNSTTGDCQADVLISTMSFAMGQVNPDGPTLGSWSTEGLVALDIPVLQAICSFGTRSSWEASTKGLSPLDMAMNVAIPEFDGRITTVPISFKAPQDEGSTVHYYEPALDRVVQVAKQARRLAILKHKPNQQKRIAFVLTNSSAKSQRIGDAVGLDTPASLIHLFKAMANVGYDFGSDLPTDGDKLMKDLIDRCSYDVIHLTQAQLANAAGHVHKASYQQMFDRLSDSQQKRMVDQWGKPPGKAYIHDNAIALAGLEIGNMFVALQPPRGYGMDADAIYHTPDLPPPHNYFALYAWLRHEWEADAIVHVGKHGTVEWLPGKGVGLSKDCFPDSFQDDMPLIYPFIVNDPGEGTQAKRRTHAVIIDHMTPPMMTADGYAELAQLMTLVDEYYQVEMLDPSKLPLIQSQIWELVQKVNLDEDLAALLNRDTKKEECFPQFKCTVINTGQPYKFPTIQINGVNASAKSFKHVHAHKHEQFYDLKESSLERMSGKDVAHLIEEMDGYLCELAGAQIRDGLHILGQAPQGDSMVETLHALTRLSNLDVPSLRDTIAEIFDLNYTDLMSNQGTKMEQNVSEALVGLADRPLVTTGDAVQAIDELAKHILTLMAEYQFDVSKVSQAIDQTFPGSVLEQKKSKEVLTDVLQFVCETLAPSLEATSQEITYLLAALDGKFVPGGPSGSPTRGMAHILPTGRNFYSVDPAALPSMAAWEVGKGLAKEVLARYLRDTNSYPEHVAISVWGTAAMRTHGDDIAEIFALLGVRPVWQRENHRVTGIELIPLSELDRPRIDVTVRISGFFRDAFPQLISLLDQAAQLAMDADEPIESNYIRKHYLEDLAQEMDETSARYRIFGCPPGAYGIAILDMIETQNWKDDSDFANCYIKWGGYAYGVSEPEGVHAHSKFIHRLTSVEVAIHNQDDREHDIFDGDDYFQFHGGLIATIRALTGKQPAGYFGDSSNPAVPRVRDVKEESLRVYRSRVVNPKWLDSIRKHGYKGASEMAATVDYLFGYDATANVCSDFMYEQVAEEYAFSEATQDFFAECNPWALQGISERLLEAVQRGMWANPKPETVERLRQTLLKAESDLEGRGLPPPK